MSEQKPKKPRQLKSKRLNLSRKEQWEKVMAMERNYEDRLKWEVHHFMMGKGKSSTITPLLACSFGSKNKNVNEETPLMKVNKETNKDIKVNISRRNNLND